MRIPESARNMTLDRVLDRLGLEPRRSFRDSMMSATGLLGAGILIGMGAALLLGSRASMTPQGARGGGQSEGSRPLTQM